MLAEELLDPVKRYVNQIDFGLALGLQTKTELTVEFLAQGEYNLNYLLQSGQQKFVLRINTGSQMNLENQIAYEFKALQLLGNSNVTPQAFYLDDTQQKIPHGLLVMEYLPGRPLDYRTDLARAAQTLARVHSLEFKDEDVEFLVKEPGPFTGIYNEACRLSERYFACPQANSQTALRLEHYLSKAEERKQEEKYLLKEPWLRVINTEVNSHNFIVNDQAESCFLIDWEKPIYGEPAQDLSHFLIETTTFWKGDYVLSQEEEALFLKAYLQELPSCPQAKTLVDRVEMFKFFNYLRAISWCAMAWTEYTQPGRPLSNHDTFKKIKRYLEPDFLDRIIG